MLSWAISRKLRPIALYDSLLLSDGVSLKRMPLYRGAQDYRNLPVAAIMTHDVFSLDATQTIEDCLVEINGFHSQHHAYTVLESDSRCVAVVSHHELELTSSEIVLSEVIKEQKLISVRPEVSIRDASHLMVQNDIQQIPILSAVDHGKLLGILTLNDIARQQNATQM